MDIQSLSVATLIDLETHTGMTLPEVLAKATTIDLANGELPPAKVLGGLAFIAARTTNPNATWDEAINQPLADLDALGGDESPEG